MHALVNLALRAAREAAKTIIQASERLDRVRVIEDSGGRFITSVHHDVNYLILQQLQKAFPSHGFNSRVSGLVEGEDPDTLWLIDPVDGNANFMRGLPHHTVSIACQIKHRITHAVLVNPLLDEEFTASRGAGARLNGKRIRVSNTPDLEKGMASIHEPDKTAGTATSLIRYLADQNCGVRISGCASLDMVYNAAGRTDAGWIEGTDPLQLGAATLILQESGGLITDEAGGADPFAGSEVFFGNPKCLKQLLQARRKL
ncbi:MAG: inositol monophosphatase family protein [Pseudohongiellaceae bacterium]